MRVTSHQTGDKITLSFSDTGWASTEEYTTSELVALGWDQTAAGLRSFMSTRITDRKANDAGWRGNIAPPSVADQEVNA
jgi:hypothetical protein